MRATGLGAIVLLAISAGAAQAEEAPDWYRRVEALVQSLIGEGMPDREIVRPPDNIDPQMALVPPPVGSARIIIPPGNPGRSR
jgi:hypothetical protein